MNLYKTTPFIKWAGGKKQLLEKLMDRMPENYNNYYEPFIGGGALMFGVQPVNATLSDINEQLVNAYNQIKANADELIALVHNFDSVECNKEHYFDMRSKYNQKIIDHALDVECAAMLIWINKHCFNGLYRVNLKGLFNVPYNNKTAGASIVDENIKNIERLLNENNINIIHSDFEKTCENVKKGDFVYFDSPYVPESPTASFTTYTKGGFNEKEHIRLAELYKTLDQKGAYLMLSNNNVEWVHELYHGFNIEEIDARRNVNRNGKDRKGKEVIITNY